MKISRGQTVLAIIACLLWSTAFAGIKIGLNYTTPINFAGVRFFLAGILTLLFMRPRFFHFRLMREHLGLIVRVGTLQTFLLYLLFYLGLARVPGSLGAVVTGFTPLWSIVLAHFFLADDRITPLKAISFLLGVSGIVTVALAKGGSIDSVDPLGLTCMIGSSLVSAASAIIVARDRGSLPAMALNGGQLIWGGLLLIVLSFSLEPVRIDLTFPYVASLLYLAFLSSAAFSIWFHLLKSGVKVSFLNLWKFIIPVVGAILSWVVLPDESPTPLSVLGILLVGGAIILYYSRKE